MVVTSESLFAPSFFFSDRSMDSDKHTWSAANVSLVDYHFPKLYFPCPIFTKGRRGPDGTTDAFQILKKKRDPNRDMLSCKHSSEKKLYYTLFTSVNSMFGNTLCRRSHEANFVFLWVMFPESPGGSVFIEIYVSFTKVPAYTSVLGPPASWSLLQTEEAPLSVSQGR